MSSLYPAFFNLKGRRCVVVGGGRVATRKVASLLRAGAQVRVIAPVVSARIQAWADEGKITLVARPYRSDDLEGACLAFAATDDRTVNAGVAHDARASGAPVNCADDHDLCDFHVPATVERDDLQVAVSTGGRSPALARQLRDDLEAWLTPHRAELLDLVADVRDELKGRGCNPDGAVWRDALDEQLLALLARGQRAQARQVILERLVPDDLAEVR